MRESLGIIFTLLIFLAINNLTGPIVCETDSGPETLVLSTYTDGVVHVDYSTSADPTWPSVNITLYGTIIENLLVIDEDGFPLDYLLLEGNLTVYSLGAEKIRITYLTQDLTEKDGRYWTIHLNVSVTATLILPEEASIVSLNRVPENIFVSDGQMVLLMSAGSIEVTYVIGIVGTRDYALAILARAEKTIQAVQNLDIVVTAAEVKLQEAFNEFQKGNYASAEVLGAESENLALQINQTAFKASDAIIEAGDTIVMAETEGRIVGLDLAVSYLEQANAAYAEGFYQEAFYYANQTIVVAKKAEKPFPYYEALALSLVSIMVVATYFIRRRRKTRKEKATVFQIDVDKLVRKFNLREEEEQAVQFLAEKGGEAFEAELFKELGLPRTSTWRLVRRLEKMEVVDIRKFRDQNLITLKRNEVN